MEYHYGKSKGRQAIFTAILTVKIADPPFDLP